MSHHHQKERERKDTHTHVRTCKIECFSKDFGLFLLAKLEKCVVFFHRFLLSLVRVTFEPTSQTNRNVHVHGIGLCVRVCVWFVIVTAMLPSPRIIVYFFERVIILCEMRTFIFASVYEIFDKSSVWVRIWLLDGFFLLFLWVSDWKERNGEREIERVCGWHAVSARGAAHSRPRQLEREGVNICESAWSGCQADHSANSTPVGDPVPWPTRNK